MIAFLRKFEKRIESEKKNKRGKADDGDDDDNDDSDDETPLSCAVLFT